jgi:hypothetical protein
MPPRWKRNRVNDPAPASFRARPWLKTHTIARYCTSWKTSKRMTPTSMFTKARLAHHQKPKLVAMSSSLSRLGGRPARICRAWFTRNATVIAAVAKTATMRTPSSTIRAGIGPPTLTCQYSSSW